MTTLRFTGCDTTDTAPPIVQPETFTCPPNKVPGWLDEHGNPQGCVDNNPTPLEPKPDMPQVVPDHGPITVPETIENVSPAPAELAETGSGDMLFAGILAVAALAAGVAMLAKGRRS